jgi:isocitrate dehydrogenase kinase/phosphatase
MPQQLTDSRLANLGTNAIHTAFDAYQTRFKAITQRAKQRFERREWHAMQADATERLDLYKAVVDRVVDAITQLLGARLHDKLVWASMKAVYSSLIAGRDEWELAETFFNSVTRRIFTTVGVDPQIEFVDSDFESPPTAPRPVYRAYACTSDTAAAFEAILADYRFEAGYQDAQRDAHLIAERVAARLDALGVAGDIERIEMITTVFYRNKGAYLVGRMFAGERMIPLSLALLNLEGVVVDAVLLSEQELNILFSFTRSYFHVDLDRPYDMVRFLSSIMLKKRLADLYISIGHNKHGKTELYRDLLHHLATTGDRFEIARGERGMVMTVFTMPSFDVVFKIIKDHFAPPKTTTRQEVRDKYRLVFRHDRAGRLVDAQEFEYLQFDRARFSGELLEELLRVASQMVCVEGTQVVIKHAYVERRVTPLNLYVRDHLSEAACAAVVDFGTAIKDLAASNIFPGDMLLKNFGVTRQGRVVFYDYDELCLLTSCVFRELPQAAHDDDEFAPEPWFSVGEHDIFPEEFRHFLGLQEPLRRVFLERHAGLFAAEFWNGLQARLNAGEVIDIFPYDRGSRLAQPIEEAVG